MKNTLGRSNERPPAFRPAKASTLRQRRAGSTFFGQGVKGRRVWYMADLYQAYVVTNLAPDGVHLWIKPEHGGRSRIVSRRAVKFHKHN